MFLGLRSLPVGLGRLRLSLEPLAFGPRSLLLSLQPRRLGRPFPHLGLITVSRRSISTNLELTRTPPRSHGPGDDHHQNDHNNKPIQLALDIAPPQREMA